MNDELSFKLNEGAIINFKSIDKPDVLDVDKKILKNVRRLLDYFEIEKNLTKIFGEAKKNGFISIPSVYSDNKAYCCFSLYAIRNFLKFSDKNEYFYIVQHQNFLNSVYLPKQNLIFTQESNIVLHQNLINNFNQQIKKYYNCIAPTNNKFLGIINGYSRPAHYFYDRFPVLYKHCIDHGHATITLKDEAFLKIKTIFQHYHEDYVKDLNEYAKTNNGFAINSSGHFCGSIQRKKNARKIAKKIAGLVCINLPLESRANIDDFFKRCSHVVWIGICKEKRIWPERYETIELFINDILNIYPHVGFVFDGLTSKAFETMDSLRNDKANPEVLELNSLMKDLKFKIKYLDLIGASAQKKIYAASNVDYFFTSAITDSMWASHFNRKPGLAYKSNIAKLFHSHYKTYIFPDKYVTDLDDGETNQARKGFSIPPNIINKYLIGGLISVIDQKEIGNDLYASHNITNKILFIKKKSYSNIIKVNFAQDNSYLLAVGNYKLNRKIHNKYIKLQNATYNFLLDADLILNANATLVVIGFDSNYFESDKFNIAPCRSSEIKFSLSTKYYRVFLKVSGKGVIKYYGYRAQPTY